MDFTLVPHSFEMGLDTKTDPRLVKPPFLFGLTNMVYTNAKAWRVRPGYTALQTLSSGRGLLSYGSEVLALTTTDLQAYSTVSGAFSSRGSFDDFSLGFFTASPGPSNQSQATAAVNSSNQVLTVWSDLTSGGNNTIQARLTDPNGVNIRTSFQVDAVNSVNLTRPQVFAMSDRFAILYQRSDNNHVLFRYILYSDTTFTPSSSVDLGTANLCKGYYFSSTDKILLGYIDGSSNPKGSYCDGTGTLTATANFTADAGASITRIFVTGRVTGGNPENLFAYVLSGNIKVSATNGSMSSVFGATSVDATSANMDKPVAIFDGTAWRLYWTDKAAGSESVTSQIKTTTVSTAGSVGGLSTYVRNRVTYGSPTQIGSSFYLPVYRYSSFPAYELLTGASTPRLVTTTGYSTVPTTADNHTFQTVYANGVLYFPQQSTATGFFDSSFASQPNIYVYTLTSGAVVTSDSLAKGHYIGSARQSVYDGEYVYENGFTVPDAIASTSFSGTGITGTYLYCYTYSYSTAKGTLMESSPSTSTSLTPANQTVNLNIRTLKLTDKPGTVKINIYRTTASGSTFFLVGQVDNASGNDTVSFADTTSDATLQTHAQLYTTGNGLPNDPPPHGNILKQQNNRLFCAGVPENPSTLYYSKLSQPYGFPSTYSLPIWVDDGDVITGLAKLGQYLLVFKKDSIFLLTGVGPDDTGQNSDFSVQRLPYNVGCVDPRSVVEANHHVYFRSRKGIYCIDIDQRVTYVGDKVAAYESYNIIGAVSYPSRSEVRFLTDGGYLLVYNYYNELQEQPSPGVWSVFDNHSAVGVVTLNGRQYHLTSGGQVNAENVAGTSSDYNDNGSPITCRLRTPWLWLDNPLSLKRYRRAAEVGAYDPGVLLSFGTHYDFIEGLYDVRTYTLGNTVGYGTGAYGAGSYGGDPGKANLRRIFTRQKAQAISIELWATCANQDFTLSGLSLEVGMKKGLKQATS